MTEYARPLVSYTEPEPSKSKMYIASNVYFSLPDPFPNVFRRFWYWALLGWRWERIDD